VAELGLDQLRELIKAGEQAITEHLNKPMIVGTNKTKTKTGALVKAEEMLDLLKDGFWRIRTTEMYERTRDLGQPVRYCVVCERRPATSSDRTTYSQYCSRDCAKLAARREEENAYIENRGNPCGICRRWHFGGVTVKTGRGVPLDDGVTIWGRGLEGSGEPFGPWHDMLKEGRAIVCSPGCWAWLVVDADEPPEFGDVTYAIECNDATATPLPLPLHPPKNVALTSTERSRLCRERKRRALAEGPKMLQGVE
jgi:hypothetical protein